VNAYRSGRIPHAWLIGGAAGVGKATLAYRMARFVLAHRNPLGSDVQRAENASRRSSDPSRAISQRAPMAAAHARADTQR